MAVSALPPTKEEEEGEPEHLEEDRFVPSNLPSALPNEVANQWLLFHFAHLFSLSLIFSFSSSVLKSRSKDFRVISN